MVEYAKGNSFWNRPRSDQRIDDIKLKDYKIIFLLSDKPFIIIITKIFILIFFTLTRDKPI